MFGILSPIEMKNREITSNKKKRQKLCIAEYRSCTYIHSGRPLLWKQRKIAGQNSCVCNCWFDYSGRPLIPLNDRYRMTSKKISKADKAEDRWTRLMFFFQDTMTLTHGSNLLRLRTSLKCTSSCTRDQLTMQIRSTTQSQQDHFISPMNHKPLSEQGRRGRPTQVRT